jgi:hypothetical protein
MPDGEQRSVDRHECAEMPSLAVAFPGPFEHHDVVVNGWSVPFLEAHMQGEDRVLLVLDRRLGGEFSVAEAERIIPFVADAVAVALGYTCHPREAVETPPILPHARPRRLTQLVAASAEHGPDEPTV